MTHSRAKRLHFFIFALGVMTATFWHELKDRFYFREVQRLVSPDRFHIATLERIDGIDLNFRIKLDGQEIYRSLDFRPNPSLAFRETLLWDATEDCVIFEVAGRRLYGYHAAHQRALSDEELLRAHIAPLSKWSVGFEGEWPVTPTDAKTRRRASEPASGQTEAVSKSKN